VAPKPHPSKHGSESASTHPVHDSKIVRRGVRGRDRGQRPTATEDPNTKQRRRRQSRRCSRVRRPRLPHVAPKPHPSKHGSESAFTQPVHDSKIVRRGVRRRDRGQRSTATEDPNTKQRRRRQSRRCSRVRWPRFPHVAPRPHPSKYGSESASTHPVHDSKIVRRGVRRRNRGQRPTATEDPNTKQRRRRQSRRCSRVRWPRFPHVAPRPHPSKYGSESASTHPVHDSKIVRRGVRRRDRGQRSTATEEPNTKQRRRRQSRHCSRVRWPRFPHVAPRPHPSKYGSESASTHPVHDSKIVPGGVRRRDRGQRSTATEEPYPTAAGQASTTASDAVTVQNASY
jgi:hypothetical protein